MSGAREGLGPVTDRPNEIDLFVDRFNRPGELVRTSHAQAYDSRIDNIIEDHGIANNSRSNRSSGTKQQQNQRNNISQFPVPTTQQTNLDPQTLQASSTPDSSPNSPDEEFEALNLKAISPAKKRA